MSDLVLHFDGGCWPNPGGTPRYAWIISLDSERIVSGNGEVDRSLGYHRTNNTAEFYGLLEGLRGVSRLLLSPGIPSVRPINLLVLGDSLLVINSVNLRWKTKKPHLTKLRDMCLTEIDALHRAAVVFSSSWIPREENREADALVGVAIPRFLQRPKPPRPRSVFLS